MRTKLIVLFGSGFLLSPAIPAAESNTSTQDVVKMLHLFIQADVNEVRFENIWVFERQPAKQPWKVIINLPDGAENITLDEPDKTTFTKDTRVIQAEMAADSPVDSIGFSYTLTNYDGKCLTFIKPDYEVNSIVVSTAGRATRLVSEVLKPNTFPASHPNAFSSFYSARDLAAGTKIEINLAGLPRRNSRLSEIVCILGLEVIVVVALLTSFYWKPRGKQRLSQ